MTYQDVFDKLIDSSDATVGGGSAAAIAGAMAAGLIGMVARLSVGKSQDYSVDEYNTMAEELDGLAQLLLQGAVADTEAYLLIKAAYLLPKEDKPRRVAAIQAAGIKAAEVPLANGAACRKVQGIGAGLVGRSNPNTASDLLVGMALAQTGRSGCVANVRVNLALIKDASIQEAFEQKISNLESKGEGTC